MPCHGDKGEGNGPAAATLNPKPRNYRKEKFKNGDKPEQVFDSISKGFPPPSPMVGFGFMPEADRQALTLYVLHLRKK